ncbi:hypothetical protein BDY21DRAFT_134368 [Lineolata rhizophorae]|uniref:Uncharacterized protein n=1 Tax=Lineolata rhizophorae TaxID=578093 RepID=A0A6A6PAC1_9PEZI|nr:hypothetical protein BDY21DRAFT_134368 [Lineolata rhizophorae]
MKVFFFFLFSRQPTFPHDRCVCCFVGGRGKKTPPFSSTQVWAPDEQLGSANGEAGDDSGPARAGGQSGFCPPGRHSWRPWAILAPDEALTPTMRPRPAAVRHTFTCDRGERCPATATLATCLLARIQGCPIVGPSRRSCALLWKPPVAGVNRRTFCVWGRL